MQGIGRLTLAFQQLAVAAMSISAIHTLQAAAVHPPITRLAAGLFFMVGGACSSTANMPTDYVVFARLAHPGQHAHGTPAGHPRVP